MRLREAGYTPETGIAFSEKRLFNLYMAADNPPMKLSRITIEMVLVFLALLLGLGVRLYSLGTAALSDGEATWALQAIDIVRGDPGEIGPQPAYVILTSFTFSILSTSTFIARIWPAVAGMVLLFSVLLFRRALGGLAVLILMVGLALDTGFVTMSRLADSPMMALGFAALALGLAYYRKPTLAGVAAGLALLSGPGVIIGVLPLALALGVDRLLYKRGDGESAVYQYEGERPATLTASQMRSAIISCAITIILVSTFFFRSPQGLAAWISIIPAYLRGWVEPSGVPAMRLFAALLVYQPLALIFGIIGAVRGWLGGDRRVRFVTIWLLFSFLLILAYPSRQVGDLVWVLLPLWVLAAIELAGDLQVIVQNRLVSLGLAAVISIILALFWLNLSGLGPSPAIYQGYAFRLGVLAGLLILIGVIALLVALGWSWGSSRLGLILGGLFALGIYGISVMWSASQLVLPGRIDLWQPAPTIRNADLLMRTVQDLSNWNTGFVDQIDVTLATDSPSLRWALRDYPVVNILPDNQLQSMVGSPSIVITRQMEETPQLAETYRGQDFAWWIYPGWQGALPADFLLWLTTRQAPIRQDQVLLWARSDLFSGGASVNSLESLESEPVQLEGQE